MTQGPAVRMNPHPGPWRFGRPAVSVRRPPAQHAERRLGTGIKAVPRPDAQGGESAASTRHLVKRPRHRASAVPPWADPPCRPRRPGPAEEPNTLRAPRGRRWPQPRRTYASPRPGQATGSTPTGAGRSLRSPRRSRPGTAGTYGRRSDDASSSRRRRRPMWTDPHRRSTLQQRPLPVPARRLRHEARQRRPRPELRRCAPLRSRSPHPPGADRDPPRPDAREPLRPHACEPGGQAQGRNRATPLPRWLSGHWGRPVGRPFPRRPFPQRDVVGPQCWRRSSPIRLLETALPPP